MAYGVAAGVSLGVDLLERIRGSDEKAPAWTVEQARATIRDWYNGYRFSPSSDEQVYNPTMALYFLDHLQRYGESPRQLLDSNLAADEDKLRFIGQIVSGQQTLLECRPERRPDRDREPRRTLHLRLRPLARADGEALTGPFAERGTPLSAEVLDALFLARGRNDYKEAHRQMESSSGVRKF
ncbi:MAG: AAA family ATPase [bacterium]|nr:AAA family ATPase [bacterium]